MWSNVAGLEPDNPNCIVGEPLNLTCRLDLNNSVNMENKYGPRDVYFTIGYNAVDPSCIHVIDESRVSLRCPATADMHEKWVRCRIKTKESDKILASNVINVGCKYYWLIWH